MPNWKSLEKLVRPVLREAKADVPVVFGSAVRDHFKNAAKTQMYGDADLATLKKLASQVNKLEEKHGLLMNIPQNSTDHEKIKSIYNEYKNIADNKYLSPEDAQKRADVLSTKNIEKREASKQRKIDRENENKARLIKEDENFTASQKLLEKIDTPEKAASLVGSERSEYLDALDTLYGNKEMRARDLGFSPEKYFHGTANADIHEFKPAKTNMVVDDNKPGSYFTPNPSTAENEAFSKAMDARDAKWSERARELDKQGIDEKTVDKILQKEFYDNEPLHGQSIYPVYIKPELTEKFSDWGVPSKSVKTQNPGVRSINAAFDPRFKDSPNILALNNSKIENPLSWKSLEKLAGNAPLRRIMSKGEQELAQQIPRPDVENPLSMIGKGYESANAPIREGWQSLREKLINKPGATWEDVAKEGVIPGLHKSGILMPEASGASEDVLTKTLGAAGTFLQPELLDLVPFGKLGKVAKMGAIAEKALVKGAEEAPKFGRVIMKGAEEAPKDFGKVILKQAPLDPDLYKTLDKLQQVDRDREWANMAMKEKPGLRESAPHVYESQKQELLDNLLKGREEDIFPDVPSPVSRKYFNK